MQRAKLPPPPDNCDALDLPEARLCLWRRAIGGKDATALFGALRDGIDWQQEEILIFGARRLVPRLVSWHGDPGAAYTYSGTAHEPRPWSVELQVLREFVESTTGHRYNSVLLNRYRDGRDGMGWHADDEAELGRNPAIASLSLGAARRFKLRHRRSKTVTTLELGHGDLLLMAGPTQHAYVHAAPKTTRPVGERINLTFRQVNPGSGRPRPVVQIALCVLLMLAGFDTRAATGSQLFAACTACHGPRAEGNAAVGAPALAGQPAAYLERQLRNFRSGLRGSHEDDAYGAQMRAASRAALSDDRAVAAVSAHIAGLPHAAVAPAAKFDSRNGNNLYQGKCAACHGGRAEGNDALAAPRLAGLEAAYLKRQLRYFRQGIRGAHANDRYGRQMALMAATVTAEGDINDLVGYIHSVGSGR